MALQKDGCQALTKLLTYGILGYIMMVSQANAIMNCRTPEDILREAEQKGLPLLEQSFQYVRVMLEFGLKDGRTVTVYFKPRINRPELLCMTKEYINHEVGGI